MEYGEEVTPQVENRSFLQDLSNLQPNPARQEEGSTGARQLEVGVDIGSVETTPSSEETTLPTKIPRQNRGGTEDDMSQSYHEIFETQTYLVDLTGELGESSRLGEGRRTEEGVEREIDNTDVISPISDGRISSEHSGSTETGQQLLLQSEVYLRDGRLVCEDDTELSRQYLTSKLVADSLMWQQTFRNDSPSPEQMVEAREPVTESRTTISLSADPALIEDIERQARRLASDVDNVIENLACILQSISALTVDTVETYRDGVCKTCDAVDDNIKGMYQLMAKWEELNKSMAPAYKLSNEIKEIKRLLDVFEAALA